MHFKKITQLSILFLLFMFNFTSIVYANQATILVDQLNVREGPGTDYELVDQVHSDEQYSVIQQQDDWVEIQLESTTGWVSEEYVSLQNQSDQSNELNTSITIPVDNLQVRSGPSTDDEILFFAEQGTNFDVLSETGEWYEIKNGDEAGYLHKDLLIDSTSFNQQSLSDKTFMIDAGHGGYDVGAISANDRYEKDIAFVTAIKLKNALTNIGAKVHLTRSNDEFIRLGSRVSSANLLGPDAFISIHYNSFPESPSASGIGSYYYHEDDQQLADDIQEELIQMTEARDRGAIDEDYQVLRHNKNSAILLELGFISNQEEADLLLTNTYQNKLVQGIVNGLVKHYVKNK